MHGTNLKQTAQFGPQMNLIKSQIPVQHNAGVTQESSKEKIKNIKMFGDASRQKQKMSIIKNHHDIHQADKNGNHFLTASS